METVGKYLKRERELRNISLKEISTATKIRENLLRAVEEDRHDLLPTPVFVKGFLIAYGKHIGLDPTDVVLRYESDLKELHGHEEHGPPPQQKRGWNRGFVLGTIIVAVGIGIILFNLSRESAKREERIPMKVEEPPIVQEQPPPPPAVPKREETIPRVEETIVVRETPPDETPMPPPSETGLTEMANESRETVQRELTLQIQAAEETWIALQVDSDLPREVTLRAGETFSQRADDHIMLKIGNAGGVDVTFNGKGLGPLGDPGGIVRLSLTHKGYEVKGRDEFEISGYGDELKPAENQ